MRISTGLLVLSILPLTGCFQNYWENRRKDLHEAFLYDAQAGIGLNADVKVGPFAWGIGLGSRSLVAVGKVDWWSEPGAFQETNLSFLSGAVLQGIGDVVGDGLAAPHTFLSALASRTITKTAHPGGASYQSMATLGLGNMLAAAEDANLVRSGDQASGERSARSASKKKRFLDHFGIEVGAFGGVVGTRAGFHPIEFLDFMLGFVGIDLLADDR